MTTSSTKVEYQSIPLTASATTTVNESVSSGLHPVPTSTDLTAFELPSLMAQAVDEVPSGDQWKKWGRWKRAGIAEAWHFYCTDSKFETLLRDPFKLINTGAEFAAEINVSSYGDDPLPVALAGLWRKRCISRIWQEQGVNVFIDLFVDGWTRELVLQGVPREHCCYATKFARTGLDGAPLGLDALAADFALAAAHCNRPEKLAFAVYGGGKQIAEICEAHNWIWLPQYNPKKEAISNG